MKKILIMLAFLCMGTIVYSQEVELTESEKVEQRLSNLESVVAKANALKISGYVQAQWQWNEAGITKGTQNTFSLRRGRIKTAYSNQYGQAVMQIDVTESGVAIKDAYLMIQAPEFPWVALTAGVFDRPFGHEISYSSSRRESPERSKVFLTLFPKERDLGAKLTLKGTKGTVLGDFILDAGLFSGNGGQSKETDSKKDFIGHLAYGKRFDNVSLGLGTSLYSGGVKLAGNAEQKAYKFVDGAFVENNLKPGNYAKREYYGVDAQLSIDWLLGVTSLRGEYLWGIQPGSKNGSNSPTGAVTTDIYSRNFNGYYAYFVQDLGRTRHSVVAKYDYYDPNTKVAKDKVTTDGDIAYSTFGFGWLFRVNQNVRVMCYYDIVKNEKTSQIVKDLTDNVFTLRLQYKF